MGVEFNTEYYYQGEIKKQLTGDLGKEFQNYETLYNKVQELLDGQGTDTVSDLDQVLQDLGLIDENGNVLVENPEDISIALADKLAYTYNAATDTWNVADGTDGYEDSVVINVNGNENVLNVDVVSLNEAVAEEVQKYTTEAGYVESAYNVVQTAESVAAQIATTAQQNLAQILTTAADLLNQLEQYRQEYLNYLGSESDAAGTQTVWGMINYVNETYNTNITIDKNDFESVLSSVKEAFATLVKNKDYGNAIALLKAYYNLKQAYDNFNNVYTQYQGLQDQLIQYEQSLPATKSLDTDWSNYYTTDDNGNYILNEATLATLPNTVYYGIQDAASAAANAVYEIGKAILDAVNNKVGDLSDYYYSDDADTTLSDISQQLNDMATNIQNANISPDNISDYLNDDGTLNDSAVKELLGITDTTTISSSDVDFSSINAGITPDYIEGLETLITAINNEYANIENPDNEIEGIGDKLAKWNTLYNDVQAIMQQLTAETNTVSDMYNEVATQYQTVESYYTNVVKDTENIFSSYEQTIINQLQNLQDALNQLQTYQQQEEEAFNNIDLENLTSDDLATLENVYSGEIQYEDAANEVYTNLLSLQTTLTDAINNYSSNIVSDTTDPYQLAVNNYYQSLVDALEFTNNLIEAISYKLDNDQDGNLDIDNVDELIDKVNNIITQLTARSTYASWDINNTDVIGDAAGEEDIDGDGVDDEPFTNTSSDSTENTDSSSDTTSTENTDSSSNTTSTE